MSQTVHKLWPRIYYFVSGLLYPGGLGVALMWFIQAFTAIVEGADILPTAWAMLFAAWFTVYHTFLFVRLMDRHDRWCTEPDQYPAEAYHKQNLWSDIADSVALFLAFGAIEFQTGAFKGGVLTPSRTIVLYVAAALVPVSAYIAHVTFQGPRKKLAFLCLVTCAVGVLANASIPALSWVFSSPDYWNYGLVAFLWVLLYLYLDRVYRFD